MSDEGLEQKYIKEAFDTNWVVPLGPNVNAFEKELERFVCSGSRLMVNGNLRFMVKGHLRFMVHDSRLMVKGHLRFMIHG